MVLRAGSSVVSYDALRRRTRTLMGPPQLRLLCFVSVSGPPKGPPTGPPTTQKAKRKIVSLEFVLCVLTFGVLRPNLWCFAFGPPRTQNAFALVRIDLIASKN